LHSALAGDKVKVPLMPSALLPAEQDAVQETFLGEALEHGPLGAIVLDENGTFLAANRAACRLTGYSREELLNNGPADLAADPSVVPTQLEEMAAGRLEQGLTKVRRKDGGLIEVEYRVGATRSGGLPHYLVSFWPHGGG
jgi:PAS domain S-box-containing protein